MTAPLIELPEYDGGRCVNARCEGSTQQRVLHVDEVNRVYPVKDQFDWWPLPSQAEYVCTVCGFVYGGISEEWRERQTATPEPQSIPIGQWDWEHESQFDQPVRDAIVQFVRGAPEDADPDLVARAAGRHLVGVSPDDAIEVMRSMDSTDVTYDATLFM